MTMLMPTRNNRFFNNLMLDPFDAFFDTTPMQKSTPALMRTDIRETDAGYEMTIDLPGFNKDDVKAELKDGYLTISAQTATESEDKDDAGTGFARNVSRDPAAVRSMSATTCRKRTSTRSSIRAC